MLAINVAAMLIAFLAFSAFIDYMLGLVVSGLSLAKIFSWVFAPVAVLMGTPRADVPAMGVHRPVAMSIGRPASCGNRAPMTRARWRNLRLRTGPRSASTDRRRIRPWHGARLQGSRGRALDELRTAVSRAERAVPGC
jgi:hypothetical protein